MGKLAIAVVDGHAALLDAMAEILDEEGYSVRCFDPQPSVLGLLSAQPPDLIILDLSPHDDGEGWHVLDGLQRDPTTCGIALILWSTNTRRLHDRLSRRPMPAYRIHAKPFLLGELFATIDTLLPHQPPVRSALEHGM